MSREAMQMALHTLEGWANYGKWVWPESALEQAKRNTTESIAALRQALETEQEPVAWRSISPDGKLSNKFACKPTEGNWVEPLYNAPPKKEWVGLTDEEIQDLSYLSQKIDEGNAAWFDRLGFARAIEAKLKEKNT